MESKPRGDSRSGSCRVWLHWGIILLPIPVFGLGFYSLAQKKFVGQFLGAPIVSLFCTVLLTNFVFCIWSGMRLAERFEPSRNRYVTGVVIGVTGFSVSIFLGFLGWLLLLRDNG